MDEMFFSNFSLSLVLFFLDKIISAKEKKRKKKFVEKYNHGNFE